MSRRRQILLDCLFLFLGTGILVRPYFLNKYTDQWPSIESTFIADARYLVAHFPHPRWQPLWYTGTRFDYIYPPALRYGTAIISMVTRWWPVKAYHFYTVFFYCLGVVGVYLLSRIGGRKRGFAILAGALLALTSPCFLFMKDLREDSAFLTPLRLGVLLRYGEGPHMTALSLLPIALGACWMAFDRRNGRWIAIAAVCCAAVISNNFYGATALVICYPILFWSFWLTRGKWSIAMPAVAIPVLAYGLMAFWLSPSYLAVTTYNLRYLPHRPATMLSLWLTIVVLTAYVCVSVKTAKLRPDRTWAVFVTGLVALFALDVLGDYYIQFSLIGDPHRLAPELDLALILGAVLLLEWLWNPRVRVLIRFGADRSLTVVAQTSAADSTVLTEPGPEGAPSGSSPLGGIPPRLRTRRVLAARIAVCVLVALPLYTANRYVRRSWHVIARSPDYTASVEYRIQDWIWKNKPDARVSTAGAVRFWFDGWHDLYELGGGSDQGLLNNEVANAEWDVSNSDDAPSSIQWLQAMAVDAVYFPGARSEEPYKDNLHEERFRSLPILYDDGQDDRIYGVPRRYPVRARVVDAARMHAQRNPGDRYMLPDYLQVVENGPDAQPSLERQGPEAMLVRAHFDSGQSLLVQESFDPAWRATANGQRLAIHKDPLGFMLVDAPAGDRTIRLEFIMPLENRVGWGVTALTIALLAALAFRRER